MDADWYLMKPQWRMREVGKQRSEKESAATSGEGTAPLFTADLSDVPIAYRSAHEPLRSRPASSIIADIKCRQFPGLLVEQMLESVSGQYVPDTLIILPSCRSCQMNHR